MRRLFALPPARSVFTEKSRLLLILTLVVTAAVSLFLLLVPVSRPYASIEAVSDLVSYRVTRPLAAAIPVRQGKVTAHLADCSDPYFRQKPFFFTGIVEPALNSVVHYRIANGRVSVQIGNHSRGQGVKMVAAILRTADKADCAVTNRLTLVMDYADGKIIGLDQPLPIAGPAEIGKEFGAATMPHETREAVSSMMWGGTVRVFGRTVLSGKLYPAANAEFLLPAGGRLSLGDPLGPVPPEKPADPMYGVARIGEDSYVVSATTVSSDLKLYRPGTVEGEAETFSLGLLTNLLSDPSVAWLILIIAIFTAVGSTLASWISFWRDGDDAAEKEPETPEGKT